MATLREIYHRNSEGPAAASDYDPQEHDSEGCAGAIKKAPQVESNMKFWFDIASAAFAFIAAALWLRSATVKIPKQFPIAVQTPNIPQHLVIGPTKTGYGESNELDELGMAVISQS